jgi:hypothetical protein
MVQGQQQKLIGEFGVSGAQPPTGTHYTERRSTVTKLKAQCPSASWQHLGPQAAPLLRKGF